MRRVYRTITLLLIVLVFGKCGKNGEKQETNEKYKWKNVQIVGGGLVSGIVFHPTEKDVCYCRTDMGGAYRRNPETTRWEALLDWISYKDANLMGVESIALDPSDPKLLYLSCGTYTNDKTPNGVILRSDDKGKTFARTDVPFKMGGNEDGRGNGERMTVDPNNGNILYLGTRKAGLWKSTDKAVTWTRIESFPDVSENPSQEKPHEKDMHQHERPMGSGIIFVIIDSQSEVKDSASSVIYAGVSLMNRDNLFRSSDAGKTWQPIPGQPLQYRPTHAVLASNGMMYITYGDTPGPSKMKNGGVWKFNTKTEEWSDITPDKPDPETRPFGYAAVSVDAQNSRSLIISSFNRERIDNGEEIYRTTDGGKTWKQILKTATFDDSNAPYTTHTHLHWMFDVEIDPFNPDHALFVIGYGGHETFNLTDADNDDSTKWEIMSSGIDETVPLDLLSPPKGAHLITGIGDYGGFVHWDLDKPAPEGNFDNPRFGNTNSIDCAENNPDIIVRTGRATRKNPGKTIGYSTDGGKSWQPADTIPHPRASLGHIAVSTDGKTWIWSPDPVWNNNGEKTDIQLLPVYRTANNGKIWSECKGIPKNTMVVADRINPETFYAMNLFEGKLYISTDRGVSFAEQSFELPDGLPKPGKNRGDSRGGQDRIYATPGNEGYLWIAAFDGLYYSSDAGKVFTKCDKVEEIHGFGFGKAAPENDFPTLFLIGTVNGTRGIFRSDDSASSWVRINDDQHQWGLLLHITGDPKKYGRVYVGTHGRGAIYGDPAE